jgi:type III pantothenate kinase
MILEVDIGNTRIKWRLREDRQVVASYAVASTSLIHVNDLEAVFESLELSLVNQVYVCSVAAVVGRCFAEWCERHGLPCVFAQVAKQQAGVTNAYTTITQMGVDRWLAMLAAWERVGHACVVVDAGSAITVDLLLANGVHHGGYIAPGLRLMNDALYRNTSQVKINPTQYPVLPIAGTSTEQAVLSGLALMVLGLIRQSFMILDALVDETPVLIVTGGDAPYIEEMLKKHDFDNVLMIPELVLDGLCLSIELVPDSCNLSVREE